MTELATTSPRVLTLHPQRGSTSVVFMLVGLVLVPLIFVSVGKFFAEPSIRNLFGTLITAGFCAAFGGLGLATWVLRVEVALVGDEVVLTYHRLRRAPERRTLRRAAITDVAVETDDGTARIVIVLGEERHPLTSTSTTDDLISRAVALREFLGLADAQAGGASEEHVQRDMS
ncbi:hypothetical protein [Nannocystis bainbridge]|uniref:PH domain-containing protein n=1 Tax=Nannocystis bainbridge TaxID=2995303 RepID=A0ABT5DR49_9BACT|nr:hypothetical protein [Nannocystis bainbridge]MDC0716074.1 hypothetical protein [Nannocystis bainbridge]